MSNPVQNNLQSLFADGRRNTPALSSWKRSFIVTFVFLTFAAGLFWLDFFREYRSQITILIISKTSAPGTAEGVAANAEELVKTLSFYDRVLSESEILDDPFEGQVPDKRKKMWGDTVTVRHDPGKSVLFLSAAAETPLGAQELVKQTAQSLFSAAGFYYDVKNDVDMRIIDGPILSSEVRRPFVFVAVSLVTSLACTMIFFGLLGVLPAFFRRQPRPEYPLPAAAEKLETSFLPYVPGEAAPFFDPRKFIPVKPESLSFENAPAEPNKSRAFAEKHSASAPAPSNLPIAAAESASLEDEEDERGFPSEFGIPTFGPDDSSDADDTHRIGISETEESPVLEPVAAEAKTGEPTNAEYKRRLNELLSGVK